MAYHVHRLARLGPPMLISGNWYDTQFKRFSAEPPLTGGKREPSGTSDPRRVFARLQHSGGHVDRRERTIVGWLHLDARIV